MTPTKWHSYDQICFRVWLDEEKANTKWYTFFIYSIDLEEKN